MSKKLKVNKEFRTVDHTARKVGNKTITIINEDINSYKHNAEYYANKIKRKGINMNKEKNWISIFSYLLNASPAMHPVVALALFFFATFF